MQDLMIWQVIGFTFLCGVCFGMGAWLARRLCDGLSEKARRMVWRYRRTTGPIRRQAQNPERIIRKLPVKGAVKCGN